MRSNQCHTAAIGMTSHHAGSCEPGKSHYVVFGEAGVWALALQDAITDNSVIVKPGPNAQRATRLSGHFFMTERPSVAPASTDRRPKRKSFVKGRKAN